MARTTRTITISVPPEMERRITRLMRQEGRTRSELIREAIRRYARDREREQAATASRRQGHDHDPAGDNDQALVDYDILRRDPTLAEIVHRLVDAYQPDRIYLFGSLARGEAGRDSDYDLMVLVREAAEPLYRLSQRAHSLLWDLGTAADVIVWTDDQFDWRTHLKASLPATILREGRLIYAA